MRFIVKHFRDLKLTTVVIHVSYTALTLIVEQRSDITPTMSSCIPGVAVNKGSNYKITIVARQITLLSAAMD